MFSLLIDIGKWHLDNFWGLFFISLIRRISNIDHIDHHIIFKLYGYPRADSSWLDVCCPKTHFTRIVPFFKSLLTVIKVTIRCITTWISAFFFIIYRLNWTPTRDTIRHKGIGVNSIVNENESSHFLVLRIDLEIKENFSSLEGFAINLVGNFFFLISFKHNAYLSSIASNFLYN